MSAVGSLPAKRPRRTPLTRQQKIGFGAAWVGWILDGMDSFIYALVLVPAVSELLATSGYEVTPGNIGFAGSVLFALFLLGWGLAFIWGPIADRFGRTNTLAASILVYAIFTGMSGFAHSIWYLAVFRLLAGFGVGGNWALSATFVAETFPEDRRVMAGGLLNAGYYVGFFLAAVLNYTIGANYGWRVMFFCGLLPGIVGLFTLYMVEEPDRWSKRVGKVRRQNPLALIFNRQYRKRTIVMTTFATCSIVGVWAGSVYVPTAIRLLGVQDGWSGIQLTRLASIGSGVLAVATIVGNLMLPLLAERFGRKKTIALYFLGMCVGIVLAFGWAFYSPHGLVPFIAVLVLLGFSGGNFAIYNVWIPEQYETQVRATAFAFIVSFGRFAAAGANFLLAAVIERMGTLGVPVALTAIIFALGLLVVPFALETRGQQLPD
jgi:MFS family permease